MQSLDGIHKVYEFMQTILCWLTHHPPPQGVGVAVEALLPLRPHAVLLAEVDEVAGEDEGEEPNVESRDQFLRRQKFINQRAKSPPGTCLWM